MIENYKEVLYENETIETERLRLRKFRKEDANDVYEYGSDPETLKYVSWVGVKTVNEALNNIIDFYWSRPGIYAIELKENRKCIGCADLRIVPEHDKSGYGHLYNRQYWRNGYARETMNALFAFCFEKLEINRVESILYFGNEASLKSVQKCGMEIEGVGKQEVIMKGKFFDLVHLGITKERWFSIKNNNGKVTSI